MQGKCWNCSGYISVTSWNLKYILTFTPLWLSKSSQRLQISVFGSLRIWCSLSLLLRYSDAVTIHGELVLEGSVATCVLCLHLSWLYGFVEGQKLKLFFSPLVSLHSHTVTRLDWVNTKKKPKWSKLQLKGQSRFHCLLYSLYANSYKTWLYI